MKATVQHIALGKYARVLAVSDIHGNLASLKGLLQKVGFCSRDALVLVGDLIEKGPDSLGVIRYVRQLQRGGNVFAVTGNCDRGVLEILRAEDPQALPAHIRRYGEWEGGGDLLLEMCRAAGLASLLQTDPVACGRQLRQRYAEIEDFLASLPTVLVSEDCIFVHAALPGERLEDLQAEDCLSARDFCAAPGPRFSKTCIVGHWPVQLYRSDIESADPVYNAARDLFGIDGGCVLKRTGQLNCLIRDTVSGCWDHAAYDGFAAVVALQAQRPSEHSFYIRWTDSRVELLQKGEEFSRCRHLRTGYEMEVLTDSLSVDGEGNWHCADGTDYCLPVQPGDVLFLVRSTSRGHLCKKNGVTGWYTGALRPADAPGPA